MDHAKKKQLKELKRKQKKIAIAKESTGDYWKRYPAVEAEFTCCVAGILEEDRQCSVLVLRKLPNGHSAMALFLIDRGVLGLKDAWGLSDTNLAEFNGRLEAARKQSKVSRISLEDARTLLAAAVKHRSDFGFRLPKDWERWTSMLGGVGLWRVADTSRFIPEFAESYDYLQRNLVQGSVEEFEKRTDVTFTWRGEDFDDDDIHIPTLEEWKRPTREELEELLEINDDAFPDQSDHARLRDAMKSLGFETGPHFEQLARFFFTAQVGPVEFGPLPEEMVDYDHVPAILAEPLWYFLQLIANFAVPIPPAAEIGQVAAAGAFCMVKACSVLSREDPKSQEGMTDRFRALAEKMIPVILAADGIGHPESQLVDPETNATPD